MPIIDKEMNKNYKNVGFKPVCYICKRVLGIGGYIPFDYDIKEDTEALCKKCLDEIWKGGK